MKKVYTEIIINSSIDRVWSVLTHFQEYSKWNPFITLVEGKVALGETIKIEITPPESNSMKFKPKVLKYDEKSEFEWLGHFIIPGLFDGKHNFKIIDNGDNTVKFTQKEIFKGLLVPFLSKTLDVNTKNGFILMNETLKEICEG